MTGVYFLLTILCVHSSVFYEKDTVELLSIYLNHNDVQIPQFPTEIVKTKAVTHWA